MIIPPRNREIGSAKLILIGAVALIVAVIIFSSIYWSKGRVMARKHEALISAIEKRSRSKVSRLLSESYSDRWEFTKEDATQAISEASSQFLALVVSSEDPQIVIEGKAAVITTTLIFSGKPIGMGGEIIREANRLKTPWVFTWQKEGFGPGSWRIISMENKSIPDGAYGYRPGQMEKGFEINF